MIEWWKYSEILNENLPSVVTDYVQSEINMLMRLQIVSVFRIQHTFTHILEGI
jgi:hypothetical protein